LNNRAGHFLDEDISAFDAPFFSISPAEAHSMDPMQRILLEVVYEAMESAGIPASTFAGTDTSCFVGCFTSDYDQIAKRDPELLPKYHSIGTGQAILSNRISYCFDLQGPSVTLDTACSSSLVAVHLACQSLRMGESKTAIVGATHAILNPDVMIGMTNLHFLSPDSKCYTFDARANGYARGEGMAALILKPLSDAIQAGDTIRAVIRGTAVNSNGKTTGITLPSRDAQVSLIRSAYQQAGCDPAVTGYCEAHGTGTAAGDPLEAGALGEALGAYRSDGEENKLFVGSIKTNIGHLEGASGLAALVKTVMSLEKGVIAPNLWYEKGNPAIEFDAWRIRVPTEASPWPAAGLRRASVNGFGYGGTNGHVILDDAYHYMRKRGLNGKHQTCIPSGSDTNSLTSWDVITCAERPRIFYLSAHEPASVLRNAKLLATHLESHQSDNDEPFLDDLAFTLCERRSRHEIASTVIASSKNELIEGLESLTTTIRRSFETPGLGFIFTGQGAQWWAMGRELMQFPVFAQSLATCEGAIESFGSSWSLLGKFICGSSPWFANDQLAHSMSCR
jgi:acyl transferase domain-containing protein